MSLINDILDLSRIQAHQVTLFPKSGNLADLLTRLFETFKIDADNRGISLVLSASAISTGLQIQFDEIRLKQVLSNLLSNAIKFTSKGEVEFGISQISDTITFFVRDTGIGITNGAGESIFNRFYKIEDDKNHLFRGTGLGLAICKSLVMLWQGNIWYESQYGKGTTFFFTHPLNKSAIDESNEQAPITHKTLNLKNRKILIAEDEESNYILLENLLYKSNAEITWAKDGCMAVEFVRKNTYDIILMDIKMPNMDGIEASAKIKELFPSLPIIAQTAYAFPTEVEEILNSGIDAYISKPIDKEYLFELIMKHLK
jgi:CheY-like chemotaxis protein/anti-sigma regulatory factor (Ser/Thr protein kinase)